MTVIPICPLLTIASCSLPSPEGLKSCEMNNCAWWEREKQCCALLSIAEELNANL